MSGMNPHAEAADIDPAPWTSPSKTIGTPPLERRYQQRVDDEQDLVVIISDYNNRRGTGKTTLSLLLADRFDRSDEGLTSEKVTMSAPELIDKYTDMPEGSALVLDEAESQANKYQASSHVNRALRKLVSMGRVEEKYLVLNMPASDQLDKDLLGLASVWILITRKGEAIVHLLANEPYNSTILTPKSEVMEWPAPQDEKLKRIHGELTERKRRRLRNEDEDDEALVKESEVQERVARAKKEARQNKRDEIIRALVDTDDPRKFGPSDVAFGFDISEQRIGQIARER